MCSIQSSCYPKKKKTYYTSVSIQSPIFKVKLDTKLLYLQEILKHFFKNIET